MTYRRRTYPEVLDNLLTAITSGVSAESHPFPPPDSNGGPFRHLLEREPVAEVISIHGSRDGEPHLFRKGTDYSLSGDKTVEWQTGGELPDPGTLIQINYYPAGTESSLTDIHTGSVVRTLSESIAREIARLYAQLQVVYESGFIDTASARSLDNVVALLGVERVRGGRATGEIEFKRTPGTRGVINIPTGTRIITLDGNIEYETTAAVALAEGQNVVRVVSRDLEPNDPLPADSLTVLAVPIVGIASVSNPAPTSISTLDESDDELRTRAKNFLHGSERATLGAIREAIARQGISADVDEKADTPGIIEITPHADELEPEKQQRLLTAINESRPAGVKVILKGVIPPGRVDLEMRITTSAGLLEQDLRAAQRAVRGQVKDYFDRLPIKQAGSVNKLVGLILSVPAVSDVRLLSATMNGVDKLDRDAGLINIGGVPTVLGDLQIADPRLPTLLNVVITFPPDADPPNRPEIEAAFGVALTYLNDMNAVEDPPVARRQVTVEKLLRVAVLPNKPGESLQAFDDAVASGDPVAGLGDIASYVADFSFTLESGLTVRLSQLTDAPYVLTPFERLSLSSVVVQEAIDG